MVLFAGWFVAIFAEIRVFSSLGVCGPTNSSDGAVRAAKRKMVGQASTRCVVRCVLHVYGRPGVCALLVVNIHQGLWFAVCRVCAVMRCACVL
jgi:hypothetical protein